MKEVEKAESTLRGLLFANMSEQGLGKLKELGIQRKELGIQSIYDFFLKNIPEKLSYGTFGEIVKLKAALDVNKAVDITRFICSGNELSKLHVAEKQVLGLEKSVPRSAFLELQAPFIYTKLTHEFAFKYFFSAFS